MAHQHLMMRRNGVPQEAHGSFLQHLARSGHAEGSETYSDFLFHEHYVWNSSRPRSAQGTIELRSACQ